MNGSFNERTREIGPDLGFIGSALSMMTRSVSCISLEVYTFVHSLFGNVPVEERFGASPVGKHPVPVSPWDTMFLKEFVMKIRLATIVEHGSRSFLVAPLINDAIAPMKGLMIETSNMEPQAGDLDAYHRSKITCYGSPANPSQARYVKDPLGRKIKGRDVLLQVLQYCTLGPIEIVPTAQIPTWGLKTIDGGEEHDPTEESKGRCRNWYAIRAGLREKIDGEWTFVPYSDAFVGLRRTPHRTRRDDVSHVDAKVSEKNIPTTIGEEPKSDNWMTMLRTVKGKQYRPVRLFAQPYRAEAAVTLTLGKCEKEVAKESAPDKVALYGEVLPVTDDAGRTIMAGSFCQLDMLKDDPQYFMPMFGGTNPCFRCVGRTSKSRVYRLCGDRDSSFVWVDQNFKTMLQGDYACDIIEVPFVNGLLDVSKAEYRSTSFKEVVPRKETKEKTPSKPVILLVKAAVDALVAEAQAAVAEAEKLPASDAATKAAADAKKACTSAEKAAKELETYREQISAATKKVADATDAGAKANADNELAALISAAGKKQSFIERKVKAAKSALALEPAKS